MNINMKSCMIFLAGVVTGSLVTKWKYTKKKPVCEEPQPSDETRPEGIIDGSTIYSGTYTGDIKGDTITFEELKKEQNEPKISYYDMYSRSKKTESKEPQNIRDDSAHPPIYIISPDSFGEFDEYETLDLTYYADHILADEDDRKIENANELVGEDSLRELEESELEAIYVRNEKLQCDYEILRDERTYSDILREKPYLVEDE